MNERNTVKSSADSLQILIGRWKDGTFGEILDDWKWIFSYSIRYKGAIAFYVILGILSTSLGLVGSVASKYLIDIITGYKTDRIWTLAILMVGSSVFSLAFQSVISRITTKLGIKIGNDIQADIFDKIMDADWLSMNQFTNGDLLNRFSNDIGTVSNNAITWLPSVLIAVYRFVATFFVILHYDWIMAIIALASAPILLLSSRYVLKKQREYSKQVRQMSSKVMTFQVETFYNYDTIKSFGIAEQYGRRLRQWQERFKEVVLAHNLFTIQTNIFVSAVGMLVSFAAFGYCLFRLWTHEITYGTMTLFLQQRSGLSSAFQKVVGIIPNFLNSSVSAHRIRELVELPREVHVAQSRSLADAAGKGLTVSLEGVDFAYVEDKQILTSSSLIAQPGQIVAIIGASGEGKTTLIRMILGLIRPAQGKAVIRGADGSEYPLNVDTRGLFAYVPQGNTILTGTIAENMRMAKEDATDEQIIQALKTACAWEFVSQLPDGIEHRLGERGRGLSEGQAQRIAIARAILRDAPVLLLDEATSALDVATERRVLRSIITQDPAKTCIVTTHRPSVLNLCQRVFRVMDKTVTELDQETSARMAMDF